MTNEQMIRELRAVAEKYKGKHVFTCETNINLMATDAANLIESLCDEISRQKEEIERLQTATEEAVGCFHRMESLYHIKCVELKVARAEAVKEFVEMLKETAMGRVAWDCDDEAIEGFVAVDEIDNLVKELTEGNSDGDSMQT